MHLGHDVVQHPASAVLTTSGFSLFSCPELTNLHSRSSTSDTGCTMYLQKRDALKPGMIVSLCINCSLRQEFDSCVTGLAHNPCRCLHCHCWLHILQKAMAKERPLRSQKAIIYKVEIKETLTITKFPPPWLQRPKVIIKSRRSRNRLLTSYPIYH